MKANREADMDPNRQISERNDLDSNEALMDRALIDSAQMHRAQMDSASMGTAASSAVPISSSNIWESTEEMAEEGSEQNRKVSATDVRRAAMDSLARREHTRQELFDKLSRKFADAPDGLIDTQLDRLAAEGLQSDQRMAEAFTRSRVRRGQGPVRIRMELKQKGVDQSLIDVTLDHATLDEAPLDWSLLASEVAHRKYADLERASSDPRFRGKVSRFLQQRGFTFEQFNHLF